MNPIESAARSAASELALALGLIRVLTLLPLYDAALDEVEQRLATAWESLDELRRLLAESRTVGPDEGE